jgi:hypothetical protein
VFIFTFIGICVQRGIHIENSLDGSATANRIRGSLKNILLAQLDLKIIPSCLIITSTLQVNDFSLYVVESVELESEIYLRRVVSPRLRQLKRRLDRHKLESQCACLERIVKFEIKAGLRS